MKTTKTIIAALALLLLSFHSGLAVNGVQLSIQGNDVHLRWPSGPCQTFIIGYRPTLDPSTPWTLLETAYAAAPGAETTYVHPGVVVFPEAPGGGEGGGDGGSPPSPNQASTSYSSMTEQQRAARREELRKQAEAMAEYLMALLREAIAKAQADRERWTREGRPQTQAAAEVQQAPQAPLGSMGFYFVAEYSEDFDADGLRNGVELLAGLNLLKADSDGDSIPDGDEDLDGDGVSNSEEALDGTLINEPDNGYPPPLLPFGTVYFIEENFTLSCQPSGGLAPAGGGNNSQDLIFLDGAADTAHGITAVEVSPGVLNVKLHSIYIGPESGAFAPQGPPPPKNNPFPKPSDDQLRILHEANGETDIGSGRIGNIRQDLYDQLSESTLDWAGYEAEYGLRKTEYLVQQIESGQRQASEALRRSLRANLVTQAKRLSAATSSLARRFGRAVGRYLPIVGGIMILSSASAIAQDWQEAFENYAADIRNGDDTTGSVAIIAALSNDLAPGSGNFVLNALLR